MEFWVRKGSGGCKDLVFTWAAFGVLCSICFQDTTDKAIAIPCVNLLSTGLVNIRTLRCIYKDKI